MERRVVITAEACICPIGRSAEQIADNLLRGVSGVRPLREDPVLGPYLHSRVFGTVDEPIEYDFARQHRKTMGPVSYYACQAVKELLERAGLEPDFIRSGRLGVAFGSIHGSPTVQREVYSKLLDGEGPGPKRIGAADYLKSMVHTTAVNITRMFGITGRVISSCTACTTGSQSIGFGYEAVKYGLQDAMICGAADEYDLTTVAVFDNLLACSTAFNDEPHRTPRPFDARRDGLVVGEGAGAVLLETLDGARSRGATILAELIGFACGNNGGDLILPNAEGVEATIRAGLDNARIAPGEVDLVSAHATATRMGDVVEAQAMHAVYGDRPWVTALKSYVGHTMSACGALETIFTLYMLERGIIYPTLNLEEVDPRCAMIRHVREPIEAELDTVAVQSFAFGGVNTCLLLRRFAP
ncbi:MAG: 3-oxoacyl-ACP synthase [Deltaproteobacteria bacterium]|nr:3-oxoacyl-ACP synthase [Deltaproteobacteria bacterium]